MRETDSGKKEGNPDPHAEIVNKMAEMISEYFLQMAQLNWPATNAPVKQPTRALLRVPTQNTC